MASLELRALAVLALVAGLLLGYAAWAHKIRAEGASEETAKRAELDKHALLAAEHRSEQAAAQQQGIEDAKNAQLRDTNARLVAALGELRKRPERHGDLPPAAVAACAGATGAELARPDAEFLAGYGAAARRLQLALGACQQRERGNYDALTKEPSP